MCRANYCRVEGTGELLQKRVGVLLIGLSKEGKMVTKN